MAGHDITQIPCGFCHKSVPDVSAVWCDGLAFHDQCYKLSLANELHQYQKKISLGTITMAESNRFSELENTLALVKNDDKKNIVSNKQTLCILANGSPVFFSEKRRERLIEDHKKSKEYGLLNAAKDSILVIGDNYKNTPVSTAKVTKKSGV